MSAPFDAARNLPEAGRFLKPFAEVGRDCLKLCGTLPIKALPRRGTLALQGSDVRRGRIHTSGEDTAAFARVYEEQVWRVYGFLAYRLGGDRETTEDLTQLTFERALRAWPRFDPRRAAVGTWLLSIAGNALVDHYRRGARVLEELDERVLPRVGGPEERFAGSPELVAALAQLGAREREVLALRYGGDLSGPEIAELLGLSLANVQQLSSRALRRLRALLDESQSLQSQ